MLDVISNDAEEDAVEVEISVIAILLYSPHFDRAVEVP